jgi:oligopeptide/dipeptide ABC transporter ATP-binding protein
MTDTLLKVEDLKLHYRTTAGDVLAVDGVDFELQRGEAMVILGESGCGKSSLTRALLRMLPRNVSSFSGSVWLDGENLMSYSDEVFRRDVRWMRISMVMQAAMNALNPVIRIGEQVSEPLRTHLGWNRQRALDRAAEAFSLVELPSDFLGRYPFELSGGMRQRAVLAMALITEPELVILDEPTSALDVLTQAKIMNVLKDIKSKLNTSFILITHDVGTSSELADRVALMYGGEMVEVSSAEQFFREPTHPYAQMLLASVPRLHEIQEPQHIPGHPPNLISPPVGCRFADRCPDRFDRCADHPRLVHRVDGRAIRCWLNEEGTP